MFFFSDIRLKLRLRFEIVGTFRNIICGGKKVVVFIFFIVRKLRREENFMGYLFYLLIVNFIF